MPRGPAARKAAAIILTALLSGALASPTLARPGDPPPRPAHDPCPGLREVARAAVPLCTHGGDYAPASGGVKSSVAATPAPCSGDGVSGKRVEVIYAVPKGRVNDYAASVGRVRDAVGQADGFLDGSTPRARGQHYRWLCENGSSVTVHNVTLGPIGSDGHITFDDVIYALQRQTALRLGPVDYDSPARAYLVFADNLGNAYSYSGQGTFDGDDRADPAVNRSEVGPHYALVNGFSSAVAEHELGHNLGAVQYSAPHSSGGAHCFDENDVMCYWDGGTYFQNGGSMVEHCATAPAWRFDCRQDDYYDLQAETGSYLASHWNVAHSSWLTPAGQ